MWHSCFLSFFLLHASASEEKRRLHLPGSHCHTGSRSPAISCFLSHSASFPGLQRAVTLTRKTGHQEQTGSSPLQQYKTNVTRTAEQANPWAQPEGLWNEPRACEAHLTRPRLCTGLCLSCQDLWGLLKWAFSSGTSWTSDLGKTSQDHVYIF